MPVHIFKTKIVTTYTIKKASKSIWIVLETEARQNTVILDNMSVRQCLKTDHKCCATVEDGVNRAHHGCTLSFSAIVVSDHCKTKLAS